MPDRRFDDRFREQAALDDGTRVLLRLLRPEDAPLLADGFRRLSPQSRYRRFLGHRRDLGAAELRYLASPDGERHLAIGALTADGKDGLGVARFVRDEREPHVAEAAIVVVDAAQGKGLGRLLLLRLVAAARERGVERFRCEVLVDNEPMRQLLVAIAVVLRTTQEQGVLHAELLLEGIAAAEPPLPKDHAVYRLFILAAAGAILVGTATKELRTRVLGGCGRGDAEGSDSGS